MEIKPIKTEIDYEKALVRLEIIFDAKKGTLEGDELEILGILIDNYENENTDTDYTYRRPRIEWVSSCCLCENTVSQV